MFNASFVEMEILQIICISITFLYSVKIITLWANMFNKAPVPEMLLVILVIIFPMITIFFLILQGLLWQQMSSAAAK